MMLMWNDGNEAVVKDGGGLVVGYLRWQMNHWEYEMTGLSGAIPTYMDRTFSLSIDPDVEERFEKEREAIYVLPAALHDALLAELNGRTVMLRDETRSMAERWAKAKAERLARPQL